MKKIFVFLVISVLGFSAVVAQTEQKSDLKVYYELVAKGQMKSATESAVKAAKHYYTSNLYKEAFDLLRAVDQNIYIYIYVLCHRNITTV